jgi:ketosteroid isomerase-like protein
MNSKYAFAVASALAVGALVLGYRGGAEGQQAEDKEVAAVRAVIEAQQAAWNRGDIEGFMAGYAREETTTFVSGDTLTRGWQTVLDRYKRNYDSRAKMGTLTFSELEFKPLSPFYIMATGRWQLARDADTPRGRFTLIFRRTTGGWRVVHDHTSSA